MLFHSVKTNLVRSRTRNTVAPVVFILYALKGPRSDNMGLKPGQNRSAVLIHFW